MDKRIELIYFNAGGGHRAAAQAIAEAIEGQGRRWTVRLVNLTEVLDPSGTFQRLTGMAPEDLYNQRLKRGWTLGFRQELKLLQAMIRLAHPSLLRSLKAHWRASQPDLVVSLVPNFNRALFQSLLVARPGVPFVTVMTDLADLPPHFWIEPGQSQHLVCGSPKAAIQAFESGYLPAHVHLTSGMVLRPSFHQPAAIDREAGRRALGLDPFGPTAVVMFGGHGSTQMSAIARNLDEVQLILMCGHNRGLADKLRAMRRTAPHAVVGFTSDVCGLMRLGDFFIGKPGPGSLSEALHLGLPVVTVLNAWTMPQERYNAEWVRDERLGIVVSKAADIPDGAARMIGRLDRYRSRVARMENRAVFEVVEILARLLADQSRAARAGAACPPALAAGSG
ncbi:MAG TPA: glycosyltransferase [Burkholderiaceae bacterium]|jgi:UDP-N-acetylglucosamine:LPS N-acetylglucosamine transferase|nr:glycosyltransferase [Burkholderiaceae bacterium]